MAPVVQESVKMGRSLRQTADYPHEIELSEIASCSSLGAKKEMIFGLQRKFSLRGQSDKL
eukprot:766480-Hanusia_phi.AAC.6